METGTGLFVPVSKRLCQCKQSNNTFQPCCHTTLTFKFTTFNAFNCRFTTFNTLILRHTTFSIRVSTCIFRFTRYTGKRHPKCRRRKRRWV